MAFPTRVRYGLRLLVRLAMQEPDTHSSMAEIAAEENISLKYLEQIVGMLRPLKVLTSIRGAHGGYVLAKPASQITLESVFSCLGGLEPPVPCLDDKSCCDRLPVCTTRLFWDDFYGHTRNFLANRTLQDLVDQAPENNEFSKSA